MWCFIFHKLGVERFARAERGSRVLQGSLNIHYGRVRAAKHAPRGAFRVLERRHGLADIGERGAGVQVERLRVTPCDWVAADPGHRCDERGTVAAEDACHAACYAQELKNLKRETWSAKQPLRAP